MPPPVHSTGETSPLIPQDRDNSQCHDSGPDERQTTFSFRVGAAMYSFAVLGLFTSSIGVMLQPISHYYSLSDLHVSLIFLVGPVGYVLAAQSNEFIHSKFGQRGIAIVGPIFHLASSILLAVHLPFYAVLVAFSIVALGTGLLDGSFCAWAGSMDNANTISGLLHGSFSVGASIGPFLAGTIMSAAKRPWYDWYFILFGASVIECAVLVYAFRYEDAQRYHKHAELGTSNANPKLFLKYRATWFSAAYFLAYVGTETAVSGWVVSFMARARHTTPYLASLSSSGFWAGMAIGRLSLGAITDKLGVRRATAIYFVCVISFAVLFAATPAPIADIVFVTFMGFFMGPLFPSGVVVLAGLLPKDLHIAAVSFVASIGQIGGALLPFGIGAIIDGLGIKAFQYAIVVSSAATLGLWLAFAQLRPKAITTDLDETDED